MFQFLPLLAKIPGKWRIIGAVGMLMIASWAGWHVQGWRLGQQLSDLRADHADAVAAAERRTREAERLARETERLQRERADAIAEAAALRDEEREVIERVVTQEVIRYVEVPRDRIVMPDDWVRIHNTAAAGAGGVSDASHAACRPPAIAADTTTPVIPYR